MPTLLINICIARGDHKIAGGFASPVGKPGVKQLTNYGGGTYRISQSFVWTLSTSNYLGATLIKPDGSACYSLISVLQGPEMLM